MKLADIPNSDIRPADAEPSKVRKRLQSQAIRRRGVLKGIVGAGMVLGISALDLLPGRNNARASLQGSGSWRYWSHCNDYDTKPAAWRQCNPAVASVSQGYCQPANRNRHRVDTLYTNDCQWTEYVWDDRCTGDNGTRINAWRWHKGDDGNPAGPAHVSCSDGWIYRSQNCRLSDLKSTCLNYL